MILIIAAVSDDAIFATPLAPRLAENHVSLSVIQQTLRNAKRATTAIYTHRTNAVQVAAHAKFLDAIKVTSATV